MYYDNPKSIPLLADELVDEVQDGVEHTEQYLPHILHRLRTRFHRHGKLRFEHVHRVRRPKYLRNYLQYQKNLIYEFFPFMVPKLQKIYKHTLYSPDVV